MLWLVQTVFVIHFYDRYLVNELIYVHSIMYGQK